MAEAGAGPSGTNTSLQLEPKEPPRKPRILLAACGCVAAIKCAVLCSKLCEFAEVKAIFTQRALHFIDFKAFPRDIEIYTDEVEWSNWSKFGGCVTHIELCRWADVLLIAPLSANSLAKIVSGLSDNLLTCTAKAWDRAKPIFVAPSMNKFFWENRFTVVHLKTIEKDLRINIISKLPQKPVESKSLSDYGNGAMPDITDIYRTIRFLFADQ